MVGNFIAFLVFLVTAVLIWVIRLFVTIPAGTGCRRSRPTCIRSCSTASRRTRTCSPTSRRRRAGGSSSRRRSRSTTRRVRWGRRSRGSSGRCRPASCCGRWHRRPVRELEFTDEAAQFFFVVGMVTLALGGGFIVSAIAAYGLSQRLGLLEPRP